MVGVFRAVEHGGTSRQVRAHGEHAGLSSSSLLLSSLELSDTKVYEPSIRALLGTASHFCEVVAGQSTLNPKTDFVSI